MQCNYMNEGCDGGWSIFHGFFAENAGLLTEECAPYTARTKGHSCSDYSHCKPYAKVTKSYYVNGYNYPPTEMQIRKEMLMHGPVTTEFKCDDNFQVYREGIMVQQTPAPERPPQGQVAAQKGATTNDTAQSNQTIHWKQAATAAASTGQEDALAPNRGDAEYTQTGFSDVLSGSEETALAAALAAAEPAVTKSPDAPEVQNLAQSHAKMAHQQLDHTIFLVGWGFDKEKNMSYWIVRNSYGDSWGMRGDFHVRRGKDDFGVESELSAYQLELVQE